MLALGGAELVLVPNACELEANRLGQVRARAFENMVAVAVANYAAPAENGHSTVVDPIAFDAEGRSRDTRVFEAGEAEDVCVVRLDLDALREWRRREVWGISAGGQGRTARWSSAGRTPAPDRASTSRPGACTAPRRACPAGSPAAAPAGPAGCPSGHSAHGYPLAIRIRASRLRAPSCIANGYTKTECPCAAPTPPGHRHLYALVERARPSASRAGPAGERREAAPDGALCLPVDEPTRAGRSQSSKLPSAPLSRVQRLGALDDLLRRSTRPGPRSGRPSGPRSYEPALRIASMASGAVSSAVEDLGQQACRRSPRRAWPSARGSPRGCARSLFSKGRLSFL